MDYKYKYGDTSSVPISFNDSELLHFIAFYLSCRYAGIENDPEFPFESTEKYIEQMLCSLRFGGLNQTRDRFVNGPMHRPLMRFYAARVPHRFDFDAECLLPLLKGLPPDAVVLDFGAGNNHFLPAMASRVDRDDIRYLATDHFVDQPEHKTCDTVQFLVQSNPSRLPATPPLDMILLRRVAHHLTDLEGILSSIHGQLKPGGYLILIEDSFSAQPQKLPEGIRTMVDLQLTESFRQMLSLAQRLTFLRFNDFYANRLFHGCTSMPLPLGHRTFSGWVETLRGAGFRLVFALDCGFPKGQYNLHQAAMGFFLFRLVTNDI